MMLNAWLVFLTSRAAGVAGAVGSKPSNQGMRRGESFGLTFTCHDLLTYFEMRIAAWYDYFYLRMCAWSPLWQSNSAYTTLTSSGDLSVHQPEKDDTHL